MLRAAQAITGREKQGQSLPAASDAEGTTLVASFLPPKQRCTRVAASAQRVT